MTQVNYDSFAQTFAKSRKNMNWPELSYFFDMLSPSLGIIDIACWSWRLLHAYTEHFTVFPKYYYGLDISEKLLDEARKSYRGFAFLQAAMEKKEAYSHLHDIFKNIEKSIFCIAWLHHSMTLEERVSILSHWYSLLLPGERVYMTNWALESPLNRNSYKNALIQGSENIFGAHDFSIKIGGYYRWYHSFSLSELEYISHEAWFTIIENRLFEGEKNFITILER